MPEEETKGSCEVCQKPAKQFCSSCKAVFYCSKECQKRGWKQHKAKCRPFSLQVHPIYGRHLVATRDIKAGEQILKEAPLLVGPKEKSVPLCLGCHKPARDVRCSKCRYPVCGIGCEGTQYHKYECAILSKATNAVVIEDLSKVHPAFSCILLLRCLLSRKHDPKTWDIINSFQDHLAEIKSGDLYRYFKANTVDFLRNNFLGYEAEDENLILKICGILVTNSFEMKHNGSRVRGMYNFSSMMAHSCVPNTKHVFEENLNVVFFSTVKIPKGTSITTNYTQVLWNTMARRQHLKMMKFFLCKCPRCSDATELGTQYSTLLCDRCGGNIISKEPLSLEAVWACNKCEHTLSAKQVRWGDAVLFREMREINKSSSAAIENFLEKYKSALHQQHRFFVESKYALVKMYGNSSSCRYRDMSRTQLENKVKWCRELVELSAVLDPGLSLFRGSVLFELQAGIVAMAKHLLSNDIITNEGAKEYMKEAADILQEASMILNHEPEMRDGGLNDRLHKLSEELEM